jgi:hypothetical protein
VSADLPPIADDLILGAKPISRFLYGDVDPANVAKVYRNPAGFSFFRHGGELAALKSTLRREVAEIERQARDARTHEVA